MLTNLGHKWFMISFRIKPIVNDYFQVIFYEFNKAIETCSIISRYSIY